MGNDGGSIPTRRELVKEPARNKTHSQLRDTQTQTSHYHWTYCALSKRPLSSPVVSDHLGRLYNKDAVIEWILKGLEAFGDGEEILKGRSIKSLKDVVSVHFEVLELTPDDKSNKNGNGAIEFAEGGERKERWVCPITRKELGGNVRAVYLVPCGCAFAEGAIKETTAIAKSDKEGALGECLQCGKEYNPRDVIHINPSAEADITRLQTRMKELTALGLTHALKKAPGVKSKKRKNKEDAESKAAKAESNIKNAATASLTNRVLADEREKTKIRKIEMSDNLKSLFTRNEKDKDRAKGRGGGDFMTRGYSLPAKR